MLFYLLNNLKTERKNSADTDDFIGKSEKLTALKLDDNKFWVELYDEYCKATSEKFTLSAVIDILAEICRARLKEIFNDDMDAALKYYWARRSLDNSRDFLWRIFSTEEISRNLYLEGGEKNAQ